MSSLKILTILLFYNIYRETKKQKKEGPVYETAYRQGIGAQPVTLAQLQKSMSWIWNTSLHGDREPHNL